MEINFDGLVGPTHNYAGLSHGNVASTSHKGTVSNPRAAALQGLEKARSLADRGFPQAILPPHERPSIEALRAWGFGGRTDDEVMASAARSAPELLAAASSASAMWTANAFTMTPSCDTADGRAHFTPANLFSKLHRSIEPAFTTRLLGALFTDSERFVVHEPLPAADAMADEGAANHTRLWGSRDPCGMHLLVYGRSALNPSLTGPVRFPARQTLESFQAIARSHGTDPSRVRFLQQSPAAIEAGVFHNDVISVGSGNLLILHEEAYVDQKRVLLELTGAFQQMTGERLRVLQVEGARVDLAETVRTYLFNSQLLGNPGDGWILVVPAECSTSDKVAPLLQEWTADPAIPIREVLAFDLRESMRNGGGPACLRNRVTLTNNEWRHVRGRVELDNALCTDLRNWIQRHYREELRPSDLADPKLLEESRCALDELSSILHLPDIYSFQH